MKKLIYTFIFLIILVKCKEATYHFPPEWENHQSIWMAWPVYDSMQGRPAHLAHLSIIENLSKHSIPTDLLVQDKEEEKYVKTLLLSHKIPLDLVRFHHIPHQDIWMRDMGPIFVKDDNKRLHVVDFDFNDWGYSQSSKDNVVDRSIAKELSLKTVFADMFSEGGAWDVNGKGVLITTEAVQFQRNPNKTKKQIKDIYEKTLGIKKIIWLNEGIPEDQLSFKGKLPGGVYTAITTGGHVDEFARFVSDDTILVGEVSEEDAKKDPISKLSRKILESTVEYLKKETDTSGKPFKIVRIPMPVPMFETMKKGDGTFDFLQTLQFEDGSVIKEDDSIKVILAASYMNYLVTNGLVLMPKYYKAGREKEIEEKDEIAKRVLEKIYPNRKVIQIDVENINIGGGGIHCITQQMPLWEKE